MKTLHEIAQLDPINYSVHIRAENIINKLKINGDESINEILQDYDEERNQSWFPKTINKLHRGPPDKIYTN